MAPNLEPFFGADKAQDFAAWLGFWATLAGAVGGVGFGAVAEHVLQGRMKSMLVFLTIASTCSYLWFALVCGGWVTENTGDVSIMLYVSCILGGLVLNGTIPLFYESAVEVGVTHPKQSTLFMRWMHVVVYQRWRLEPVGNML